MGGDFGLTRMTMAMIRASQRERERQRKHAAKMQAVAWAEGEVNNRVLFIQRITSLHTSCSPTINWESLAECPQPIKPERQNLEEVKAIDFRKSYKPGFWVRLFNLTGFKMRRLDEAIIKSRAKDEANFKKNRSEFDSNYAKWEKDTTFAKSILSRDLAAYKSALDSLLVWQDAEVFGKILDFKIDGRSIEIDLNDNLECVPRDQARALRRGDVSYKQMPIGQYNEICLKYVCSRTIRAIRETFAILPLDFVQINVMAEFVNPVMGLNQLCPLLSVRLRRDDIKDVIWENIAPHVFIEAFPHQMNFKKTKGFGAVMKL